ncbi:MAG: adenosine deaminase [Gemmatimonadota bacterium]|nr:adenosine deaminase [Gemmatimonadota bacterium]MDH5758379.1 adenosine deaminase [Gemmatimonadota bacterium]
MTRPTVERLRALPKTELHVHLDGSLRPETMLELAREYGKELPSTDLQELAGYMLASDTRNLEEYLDRFRLTLSVMQHADALERIAYELAIDNHREGVRYMEVRYSPILHTQAGLPLPETVDAPLRGLRRAEEETGIRTAIIICGIRNMEPETSRDLADLTVAYKGRGVVAFDLAGAEYNYPAKKHKNAFFTVINRNMPTTIHAGEAYGPESIHQALHYCRANRIGHGTRLFEDADLMAYVRDLRIPLEICPTSNVQTRVVETLADHPIRRYFDEGIVVTLNTDNILISGTTLTREYELMAEHLGFTWSELVRVARMGFESAFLSWPDKQAFLREFDAAAAGLSEG